MAASGHRYFATSDRARVSTRIRSLTGLISIRAFLDALPQVRKMLHLAANEMTAGRPEQKMMRASEYLEICEENALDASTIEDALYWHNEIITELSLELNLVRTATWPDKVKTNMMAALEHRLDQHAGAVTRLAAILEKNEQFIWQP